MDTEYSSKEEEMEPALSEEAEPASDFEVAADAAYNAGSPEEYRRALKEAIMACMGPDYGASEAKAPKKGDGGLALVFGKG